MKVPNKEMLIHGIILSLSRLQNEGSQPALVDLSTAVKSIKATE